MALWKKERLNSAQARNTIRSMQCLIRQGCNGPVETDHIKTIGSGGQDFIESQGTIILNIWPLCVKHHQQRHQMGIKTFIETYRATREYLKDIRHPMLDE